MEKLISILSEVLPEANAEECEDLFEEGLDSMGVMTIITMIQSEFDIEIDPEDITADNFVNLTELEKLIKKYTK